MLLPVACTSRSPTTLMKTPKEKMETMEVYSIPIRITLPSSTKAAKKGRTPKMPKSAKAAALSTIRNTPFVAVRLASSKFFSPSLRERMALTPTAVPTEMAIIIACTGKARETAVRASSLTRMTKMLSTTL